MLPFPSLDDPPDPEMEPTSPALAGIFFTTEPPGKLRRYKCYLKGHAKMILKADDGIFFQVEGLLNNKITGDITQFHPSFQMH